MAFRVLKNLVPETEWGVAFGRAVAEGERALQAVSKDGFRGFELKIRRDAAALAVYLRIYRADSGRIDNPSPELFGLKGFEGEYALARQRTCVKLDWYGTEKGFDFYKVGVPEGIGERGLYFYSFEVNTPHGRFFGGADGSALSREDTGSAQLLIFDEKYAFPKWLGNGIIYHIFVDRFARGGEVEKREDAVYYKDWFGTPEFCAKPGDFLRNNTFFGGTLYGIIDKLDYIKSLGVSCIYLSPVFKAYSNHKYDTGDYMTVDEGFGGDEALEALFKAAKEKGIFVILDGVFNHVGDDSLYFNHFGKYDSVGAYQSEESPFYKWFNFFDYPDGYDAWWGIGNLPKVNKGPEFRKYICGKGGVIDKYMKMGAGGFRLDVVDELEASFTDEICKAVKRGKKDAYIVGEVWEDASNKRAYDELKTYFQGVQLDSVMNYPFKEAIISYVKSGNSDHFVWTVNTVTAHYPPHKTAALMNILGTHDTERILTVLGCDNAGEMQNCELAEFKLGEEQRKEALLRLKIASLLQFTLPGIPCVYYGDEAGLEGGRDPFNRRTYPWGREDTEILSWYRSLGKLRNSESVFAKGDFEFLHVRGGLVVYRRFDGEECIVIAVNLGERSRFELEGPFRSVFDGELCSGALYLEHGEFKVLKAVGKSAVLPEKR